MTYEPDSGIVTYPPDSCIVHQVETKRLQDAEEAAAAVTAAAAAQTTKTNRKRTRSRSSQLEGSADGDADGGADGDSGVESDDDASTAKQVLDCLKIFLMKCCWDFTVLNERIGSLLRCVEL